MNGLIKISLAICFPVAIPLQTEGQNLVPNPSFEEYSQCPDPATLDPMPDNMIELATGWGNPTGYSPDYFNSCVPITNGYGVPQNGRGFQNARTGNAYAGLISMIETDSREYIQTELTQTLIAGKQYLVTFYVSLCEVSTYASNNIGAYFYNNAINLPSHMWVLSFSPQIANNPVTNPLTDTLGWTEVSGTFTALGGEKYMIIGNFNDDASTDTIHKPVFPSPAWTTSYHYIDDVSVVCLDCTVGTSEPSIESRISIFPNPATDYLTINFDDIYPEKITLFNSVGETLLVQKQISDGSSTQINVSDYQAGIYFMRIETKDFSFVKQFLITK